LHSLERFIEKIRPKEKAKKKKGWKKRGCHLKRLRPF
jgi:hypothetical protein